MEKDDRGKTHGLDPERQGIKVDIMTAMAPITTRQLGRHYSKPVHPPFVEHPKSTQIATAKHPTSWYQSKVDEREAARLLTEVSIADMPAKPKVKKYRTPAETLAFWQNIGGKKLTEYLERTGGIKKHLVTKGETMLDSLGDEIPNLEDAKDAFRKNLAAQLRKQQLQGKSIRKGVRRMSTTEVYNVARQKTLSAYRRQTVKQRMAAKYQPVKRKPTFVHTKTLRSYAHETASESSEDVGLAAWSPKPPVTLSEYDPPPAEGSYSPSSELTDSPPTTPKRLTMPRKRRTTAQMISAMTRAYPPDPGYETPPVRESQLQTGTPTKSTVVIERRTPPTGTKTKSKTFVRTLFVGPTTTEAPTGGTSPVKLTEFPPPHTFHMPIGDFDDAGEYGYDPGDAKEIEEAEMVEVGPELAQVFHVPAQLPQLEPDVQPPRVRRPRFRAQASGSFDAGNAGMFHVQWLQKAGRRADVPIAGGMLRIRPKSVTIDVHTFSFATRTDLTPYLVGHFRLGGHIDGKNISSARLLRYVFSKLPGSVTISY